MFVIAMYEVLARYFCCMWHVVVLCICRLQLYWQLACSTFLCTTAAVHSNN